MEAEAKITSKGQITLPAKLRARLKVGPGDRVVFAEGDDGKIVVRGRGGSLAELRGILRHKVTVPKGANIDRWIDEARSRALPRGLKQPARRQR
jgi:AbrB family looped-hinge helix DNA binding protein